MITRIVKLEFEPTRIDEFLCFFEEIKWKVAKQPSCIEMKLLRDASNPNLIFTYSIWENEKALNDYRNSELFSKIVWPKIKPWFKNKAEAWTVDELFCSLTN